MKKIIFTILTTITILGVNAQGNNLQFNRALFERYDIDCIGNFSNKAFYQSNTFTVPTNKVWKINKTSVSIRGLSSSDDFLFFSTEIADIIAVSLANENKFFLLTEFPSTSPINENIIWLPSGTYDIKVKVNHPGTYDIIFNGIEFNIVQ